MNQYDSSGNILGVRASIEYNYNSSFSLDGGEKWFCGYSINAIAERRETSSPGIYLAPHNQLASTYLYDSDLDKYSYSHSGGMSKGYELFDDENLDYNFVKFLKSFTMDDILECEFGEEGNYIISFYYIGNANIPSTSYIDTDYI